MSITANLLPVTRPPSYLCVSPGIDVPAATVLEQLPRRAGSESSRASRVRRAVAEATHLLPAQGPITVFVHHNCLHALEDLPFDRAVQQASQLYGCHPYLPEAQYRELLAHERIRVADLKSVLDAETENTDRAVAGLTARRDLRLAMLEHPLPLAAAAEMRWYVAESSALWQFRKEASGRVRDSLIQETQRWVMRDLANLSNAEDSQSAKTIGNTEFQHQLRALLNQFDAAKIEYGSDATWQSLTLHLLWHVSELGAKYCGSEKNKQSSCLRHRDLLLEATGHDSDLLVHDVLIRFCGVFLDQGFATWNLPEREQGFLAAFINLYGHGGPSPRWLRPLSAELRRIQREGLGTLELIEALLDDLGVADGESEEFLVQTLLALRGWAGILWQMESNAEWTPRPAPPATLFEFLAVRLLLEKLALTHIARQASGMDGSLAELRNSLLRQRPQQVPHVGSDQLTLMVFQLAQVLGWTPEVLLARTPQQWSELLQEIQAFSSTQRRRIYHHAFERRYRNQTLDALAVHANRGIQTPGKVPPSFQVVCCLDEREESFRRHLEEIAPDCETFGAAGFYGVAMYFRGISDAHYVPLCPVVVKPQHFVREEAVLTFEHDHQRRARALRALGKAGHRYHIGSRLFFAGALTSLLGSLASAVLVARILAPRLADRITGIFDRFVKSPPVTRLCLERSTPDPGKNDGELGYTISEMAAIVGGILRGMGLTQNFSRLVVMVGHGSSSLNNPHEAAHDCGACGGGRGGPNARAFANMANDPRVQAVLAEQGLQIPKHVVFVGAYHNTCDDAVIYYDLDLLPASHKKDFLRAQGILEQARRRNAHERCRRFESAPLSLSAEAALRHVEARAVDLSQVRPEYGHATNAICIVGRRERTRNLFLDRRAFLTSYDPQQDDAQSSILAGLLSAVIPVCAGINLEYYFSFVDPTGYGCNTKLPHNVTSMIGVMDGAASDMRPGLPWQMVEIHEPVRLLFIIETLPERMQKIMQDNEAIARLCNHDWVQLATLSPSFSELHLYHNGRFELYRPEERHLPEVQSSIDWYRGWRGHLGYAVILGDGDGEAGSRVTENGSDR